MPPSIPAKRRLRATFFVVASLALLLLPGCGGGSDFASKADAICKQSSAQLKAIPRPTTPAGVAPYLNRAGPLLAAAVAKLKTLKAPSDKQAAYQAFLAGSDEELAVVRQAVAVASGGDIAKAASLLQQQSGLITQLHARAKAAGLSACAKD